MKQSYYRLTQFFSCLLFLWLLFFSSPCSLSAQNLPCGTPDIPLSMLQSIKSQVTAAKIPVRKIPLWIYLLRDGNGQTITGNLTLSDVESFIPALNSMFSNVFEFTICGSSIIDDDQYYPVLTTDTDFGNLQNTAETLGTPSSDHCVRVFVASTIIHGGLSWSGYTYNPVQFPDAPGVIINTPNEVALAHELGHYFFLPHTFQGGPSDQYVNFNCLNTGDSFCETPADPGPNLASGGAPHCTFTSSGSTCVLNNCDVNDPLGVPYQPDPHLIMSYYQDCPTYYFTSDQKSIMLHVIDINPTAYGNLITNVPTGCLLPDFGFIERNCEGVLNAASLEPIKQLNVKMIDGGNISCTTQTDAVGKYVTQICNFPSSNSNVRILPDKEFDGIYLNGVTTNDLVLISKHINGLQLLPTPYMMIAADANGSGSITATDVSIIRKLILGITAGPNSSIALPAGNWRFISRQWVNDPGFGQQFSDGNPFDATLVDPYNNATRKYLTSPGFESWMDYTRLITSEPAAQQDDAWSFYAIKVGDVNCNALVEFAPSSGGESSFLVSGGASTTINSGTIKKFQVMANVSTPVVAWQFGAHYPADMLDISQISAGNTGTVFESDNFSVIESSSTENDGTLRAIWYSSDGTAINMNNKVLFEMNIDGQQPISHLEDIFKIDPDVLDLKFYDIHGDEISNVTLTLNPVNSTHAGGGGEERSDDTKEFSVQVSPVPFISLIDFNLFLPMDGLVSISLFDQTGRLVSNQTEQMTAGAQNIRFNHTDAYPSGMYYYKVEAGEYHKEGKIFKK